MHCARIAYVFPRIHTPPYASVRVRTKETPMAETGQHDQRYERYDGGSPEAERLVFER